MDRLSALPRPILHAILAKLPDKDAAKTIALSKAWRDTWFSFPYLSVCSDDPMIFDLRFCNVDILVGYVTKRLLRLHDQGLAIKEFKLNLKMLKPTQLSHNHFDRWIQIASESGIEVLELYLPGGRIGREYGQRNWYILPLCVPQAKSLTKLLLSSGIRVDREFLSRSMKFSSLKMLSLCYVRFTHEGILQNLVSHCPLIEHLYVENCFVYNVISTEDPVDRFDMVKSLFLNGFQKLKEVHVQGIQESTIISDKWFLELFSKYPFLESLKLDGCPMSETINITSARLKVLKLFHCSNLKEVNIDAPHLISLDYCGFEKLVISLMTCSDKLEVSVDTRVDYQHSYSLRDFIQNMPQKILASLSLIISPSYRESDPSELIPAFQVFSNTPPRIKHLELRERAVPSREVFYGHLMHCLLSSCFPEKISFSLVMGNSDAFIEVCLSFSSSFLFNSPIYKLELYFRSSRVFIM
ncbi:hypothetical protein PIB30_012187 [Stylosanthes scabra]|uniref:F-box domain-containing protein n=1 Tax=Stylosanthes scabra TaxID=79078 RepID=A0ABU6U4Q1_9FABA|nr:hypothetical protein [Stylosanthes scabra]